MKLEEEIAEIAEALVAPAGSSAKFANQAAIEENREAFIVACHDTWKELHTRSIRRLLFHEGFLKREKTHPIGRGVTQFAEYNRAVWRRVNDAIIWTLNGQQRHRVKRLCFYRQRYNLLECNPDSVMATLAELNTNPMALALWNDATSCVDIGDITLIRDGRMPLPEFIELKEGVLNAEIADILKAGEAEQAASVVRLRERHGEKAVKQMERMRRQALSANQALDLLRNEMGVDPVTGHEIRVVESLVKPDTYDDALRDLLDRAKSEGVGKWECIDGCLWVYAAPRTRAATGQTIQEFDDLLGKKSSWYAAASQKMPPRDRDRITSLSSGVHFPMAKPLYFRGLKPEHCASVTIGAFHDNVLLYLDWNGFRDLITKAGGNLVWGTKKEAGRANAMHPRLRPSLVRGQLPFVHSNGVKAMVIDPNFVELFYDGITPWTLAQRLVEHTSIGTKDAARAE